MFWEQAEQVIEQAKANGSLYPIATEAVAIEQNGITYLGHIVAKNSAQRKFTPKPTADFNLSYLMNKICLWQRLVKSMFAY